MAETRNGKLQVGDTVRIIDGCYKGQETEVLAIRSDRLYPVLVGIGNGNGRDVGQFLFDQVEKVA